MGYTFQMPDASNSQGSEDDAYEQRRKSIQQIATLQTPAALPNWLTTNPDSLTNELLSMYGNIPKIVNPSGVAKAYDTAIGTTEGMGGQIANNAAAEEAARGSLSGGQVNTSMVKAQSMLPVYDTTSKLRTDKASAVLEARKSNASMMSAIAGQLANLRTNYLTSLGNIQTGQQNTQNSWVTSQEQLRQHQQENDRQYQLTLEQLAAGRTTPSGGSGGGGGSPGTYSIQGAYGGVPTPRGVSDVGYITNSGPLTPASFGGNAMMSPVTPFDGSSATINGWGKAGFSGGKELGPKAGPTSMEDWLRLLGGAAA